MLDAPLDGACPGDDEIAAYLWGGLGPGNVAAMELHIASCSACRGLLSVFARTAITPSQPSADSVSPTMPIELDTGSTEVPIGASIGRYIVLDRLGAGGMGVVYAAHDPQLNRNVALKVLRNDRAIGDTDRPVRDLLREAQAMARLAHPNVVRVFDVGSLDDRVFIAMELIDGQTLARWLRTEYRDRHEIIAAFVAAGNGLAAAHAAGLIHRDFKPDNVLVGNDGRVCVTDFGLARLATGGPLESARRDAEEPGGVNTTRTGLAGTVAYMAPEQYLGRGTDARADQFSFAVALYEALHGERPSSPLRLAAPDGPASPRRGMPRGSEVQVALLRALRPVPDERYPSMAELLAALGPEQPGRRRGGSVAVIAVVLAVLTVAAAGGYAFNLRRTAEQRTALVGRLRGMAPEIRTLLRSAHLLPLHDIRPARDEVRSRMREVERQLQTRAGQDEIGLGDFVLGEAHRALGDHDRALGLLEAAWAAGEHGADIDAALGYELGAAYERLLEEFEDTVPSTQRKARIEMIESRYRDPAMAHLRAALVTRVGSPAYLDALIAFHDHRFADASRSAHAAFAESPTLFEAGALEARARNAVGRELLASGQPDESKAAFADARRIFQSVLEVARSDEEMWLGYSEMVFAQAVMLIHDGALRAELRHEVVSALRNVQRIDPDNWMAFLREAQMHLAQGNIEVLCYRDPSRHVDEAMALAEQARAHGAVADEVDKQVCMAHWQRAGYQGVRGIDPHPSFKQAIAVCGRAAAARPNPERHDSLGTAHCWLASYEGAHGANPMWQFELCEQRFRAVLALRDDAAAHYSLGRLWTMVADYRASHGMDPQRAVDDAVAEYQVTLRMTVMRTAAWAETAHALVARARFQRQMHDDARPTLRSARTAVERALAIDAGDVVAIRYRLMLDEIDAEVMVEHNTDPGATIERMRGSLQMLSNRAPDDSLVHVLGCRAELLATRWALAHDQRAERPLTRAASEAARAREADAMNAVAWTASAEVEYMRIESARARGVVPSAAASSAAREFIERALAIDPLSVRALRVRNELARQARAER